jgi:hypothetical protein
MEEQDIALVQIFIRDLLADVKLLACSARQ